MARNKVLTLDANGFIASVFRHEREGQEHFGAIIEQFSPDMAAGSTTLLEMDCNEIDRLIRVLEEVKTAMQFFESALKH